MNSEEVLVFACGGIAGFALGLLFAVILYELQRRNQ